MQKVGNRSIAWKLTDSYAQIVQSGTVDFSAGYVRKSLAEQIKTDIDTYAMMQYNDGFRNHLGASVIGAECARQTWYSWRWMKFPSYSGRMQRLFQRGHLEENRYEEYLRGIGCNVWLVDPNTGKQFRITNHSGHFGGSLDAIGRLPPRYGVPSDLLILCEFKTIATGRGFQELLTKGVMLSKPQHYDQMCIYGANYNYRYALYMNTCKNDDDMHVEIVELDHNRAKKLEQKAGWLIAQQTPPPRIATVPTYTKCKNCDYAGICWDNHIPAKNCRSCVYATPGTDGEWICSGYNAIIPKTTIPAGCPQWTAIKSVP